jgi:hypothetical protein
MKMRCLSLFTLCGLLAGATSPARASETIGNSAAPVFSWHVNEVVKLAQSGVDESVVTSYINTSPSPFQPTADEIIKLRDVGVSPTIVTAMLQHDATVRNEQAATQQAAAPAQNSYSYAQPAPTVVAAQPYVEPVYDYTPPVSTVVYIGGSYGYPSLGYRNFGYPYSYYSSSYYSYSYPRVGFYGGFYPHVSVNAHFGGGFSGGFHGGFGGGHGSIGGGGHSGGGGFHGGGGSHH